jgi:hypothetical protein
MKRKSPELSFRAFSFGVMRLKKREIYHEAHEGHEAGTKMFLARKARNKRLLREISSCPWCPSW